jgi:DNA processing protein
MCHVASELGQQLAQGGVTVVSGLALGIDGAAHRGSLASSSVLPTIGVLAHGLERIYPPSHEGLARQIVESGGALVSEYPPGTEPMKHHFLARNRIIAGLSRGVVVVEAGVRSGSLVTAQFAADFGRDVFVVTQSEVGDRNAGGDSMIEQGAHPIRSAAEVLREYGLVRSENESEGSWRFVGLSDFVRESNLSASQLLQMEIEGTLVRLSGNMIRVVQG